MANFDAALMEEIFDIVKRAWQPDLHKHTRLDDSRRRFDGFLPIPQGNPCPKASSLLSQKISPSLTNTPHTEQQG